MCPKICVWADRSRECMRRNFAEKALRRYKATGEDVHDISSLAEQRAIL